MKKWIALAVMTVLILIDQIIKAWALETLEPLGRIVIIPGLFNLTYVENRGAAFGIFQGETLALSAISGAMLFLIVIVLMLGKIKPDFLLWCACIGLAGGFGNFYDRVFRGFVVDYLDFSALFGFPVFNFADCLVVCATALILIYSLRIENGQKNSKARAAAGEES